MKLFCYSTCEPVWNHDRIDSGSRWFDGTVEPPVFGLSFLNAVMSRLISLDGNNLLDEVGHTLGAASDLLASVVELLETLCPAIKSFIIIKAPKNNIFWSLCESTCNT